MAKNVFNPNKRYRCRLHLFTELGRPSVVGSLAADTVVVHDPVFGIREYAVFTVDEPQNGEFPPAWVGTYRLPMDVQSAWFGGEV